MRFNIYRMMAALWVAFYPNPLSGRLQLGIDPIHFGVLNTVNMEN